MNTNLIKKALKGVISFLDYMNMSGSYSNFEKWCREHGVRTDEEAAEFYFDMTVDIEEYEPAIIYDIA